MITAAILLTACGKPAIDESDASANEVARAVDSAGGGDMKLAAGRWEATTTISELKAAGLPPEVAAAMQGAIGQKNSSSSCLTKEEVEKPGASFFAKNSDDCTYDHFRMGDGRLDAKMICKAEGGKTTVELAGTYSSKRYEMAMQSQTAGGEQDGMTMKMTIKGAHVGACRGDETA